MVCGLFERIRKAAKDIEFTVSVSMIEIYNERIRDLLKPSSIRLKIRQSKKKGVYVANMS